MTVIFAEQEIFGLPLFAALESSQPPAFGIENTRRLLWNDPPG
jgi:hypothetical protein